MVDFLFVMDAQFGKTEDAGLGFSTCPMDRQKPPNRLTLSHLNGRELAMGNQHGSKLILNPCYRPFPPVVSRRLGHHNSNV
jgi:hypothetical protein